MIKFTKYHGCGNDFIIINSKALKEKNIKNDDSYAKLATSICHRNTGVGADGLIIVVEKPEDAVPVEMIIFNSDGSYAPMCGNGIRCFAKYCYDEGIATEDIYPVKTGAGVMIVGVKSREPFLVEIDMGKPDFNAKKSAIDTDLPEFINQKIDTFKILDSACEDELNITLSTFFMGTIHTVIWEEDGAQAWWIEGYESREEFVSNLPIFKEKTNVNVVTPIDRDNIKLKTYERGAGYTLACGTGACASVVYGIREGKLNNKVKVMLPLGELIIRQDEDGTVFMEGPSEKIAEGEFLWTQRK